MSARHKLNVAAVTGAVALAAFLGGLTGSWPVGLLTLALTLAHSFATQEIRLTKRPPKRRRR